MKKVKNSLIILLKLLLIFYQIGYSLEKAQSQDNQNYYFNSQHSSPNHFIPSYTNTRGGFIQQGAGSSVIDHRRLRSQSQQQAQQPDSYQEQTIFIGNPNTNNNLGSNLPVQDVTTPNYFTSFPSYTTTRHSNSFEISPRPFSPSSQNSGFSYTRDKQIPNQQSSRNTDLNQRTQKQQQQSRFTPINPITEKTPAFIGQRAGPSSYSSSFNRNKNTGLKFDYYSNEDYRNTNRNTFRNNRFRTTTTSTTSSEEVTTYSPTRRKNRFSPSSKPITTRSPKPIVTATKSSLFQTRRPVTNFNSGEIYSNEFPSRFTGNNNIFSKPINTNINITHNGSTKFKENSYEENVDEVLLDENYDYIIDKKHRDTFHKFDSTPSTTTTQKPIITTFSYPKFNSKEKLTNTRDDYSDYTTVSATTTTDSIITNLKDQNSEISSQEINNQKETIVPPTDSIKNDTKVDLDEHTVILTDNFYLPKKPEISGEEIEQEQEDSSKEYGSSTETSGEYEYDYEDYSEEDTDNPATVENITEKTAEVNENNSSLLGEHVVSVVTTKSVINGSVMDNDKNGDLAILVKPIINGSVEENNNGTTESWVVVASVQTSRSVSGARFLPFPSVSQDEKKQALTDIDSIDSNEGGEDTSEEVVTIININSDETTEPVSREDISSSISTTIKTSSSQSTESIIDKLDRVQSELSSGVLSGKFPILQEMAENVETTTKISPFRKFGLNKPNFPVGYTTSTTSTTNKPDIKIESLPMDDISALLPPGFKSRPSYKNRKLSTPTTTTTTESNKEFIESIKPLRNSTNTRSFKNNISAQDVNLAGLLPKGYKPTSSSESETTPKINDLLKNIKFEESLDKLLPSDYKPIEDDVSALLPPGYKPPSGTTTKRTLVTLSEDVNKFLPPGYQATTTKRPLGIVTISEDVSKFLPPGFRSNSYSTKKPQNHPTNSYKKTVPPGYEPSTPPPQTQKENKVNLPSLPIIPISDNLSKFLPPGYKLENKEKPIQKPTVIALNEDLSISKLLPPGYKEKTDGNRKNENESDTIGLLNKIQFKDVSDLVPPEFKLNSSQSESSSSSSSTTTTTTAKPKGASFPKLVISNKKPGQRTITTTIKPVQNHGIVDQGPGSPGVVIKKGPPTRATTEFTGWPTQSTTPFSIEKLLEQHRIQNIDVSHLLPSSSESSPSTTRTTTTTTTTTTTPKPTIPGVCRSECNLAGTIKIVDGVNWTPELLDHNTDEWKNLAREVEIQLNEVYSKADTLKKWYKSVRIDSFSKGSVLVDYWIELSDLTEDIDTLEIKRLFHEALIPSPMENITVNASRLIENSGEAEFYISEPQTSKSNLILGKFIVDPISTDFIVLPKSIQPTVGYAESDVLLPQWAVAVIVIGLGSLLFVILFGVTVIVNRQKRSKKKAPTPLTADMLNELNKNHMGGLDNYGREELYNIDDAWEHTSRRNEIKPKRFTNSMHGSSQSNIYDSWRSQRHVPPDYYYEHNNYFSHSKNGPYPSDDYPESHHNSMSMYTYNPRRVNRNDYDADF